MTYLFRACIGIFAKIAFVLESTSSSLFGSLVLIVELITKCGHEPLYKSEMRIVMIQTTLGDARVKPGALLLPVAMVEEPYDTL